MKPTLLLLPAALLLFGFKAQAQDIPVHPKVIQTGTYWGLSRPLRDIPAMTPAEFRKMEKKGEKGELNEGLNKRVYPYAATALPQGPDPAWQNFMGTSKSGMAPLVNFDGQNSPYYPPDCNGTAGPGYFMQTINTVYAIYSKTGTLVAGPTNINQLFGGVPGSNYNDGDPIILYDEQADRWVVTEFSISGSTDYILFAVSSTNDPTGTWHQYSFAVASMPDYPKFSVWRDGYYMGDNNSSSNDTYVFERTPMLSGGTAQMVGFNNPYRPASVDGFMCVPPVDNDGAFAPSGTPGLYIAFNDDAIGGGSDQLWLYELSVNWTTPSSSTFNRTQQINVQAFDSNFGNNWDNITQPNSQKLDAIPQVIMNAPQYRNFGSYQTIVCCHTVDVDGTNHAGIRWYELRKTTGTWSVRQQGTYAPDANNRWMGSIMLNGNNKIALGYSVSSSTVYPSIRYCGQSAGAYTTGAGVLDIPEDNIWTGAYAQSGANRWGDYALMSVDPTDDDTFWFTTEYIGSGGSRKTRIASFKFGNSPSVVTLAATAITSNSATLNGTVNPNGISTTYYFQWGTTVSYGNTTTTASAGSGTSPVNVSAPLAGLTPGATYHYRVVGVNTDGTNYGADMTFTPGAASVSTTAASAITLTTATSGGNVTSDGGSSVTARGVCWATTANPSITDNHTTDGAGLGVFVSSITGLSSSTTYHVRAYATNANGTFYGNDDQFTTLCGTYTLPFTEGFAGTTIPNCWTQVDHQGNGQIWTFGVLVGQSPPPALNGNYAFLDSDGYGSGNSQNADLVTPTLDLTGYSTVTLQFNHYFKSYTGSSATVSYSIDNGSTWTQIQQFTTTSATNPEVFNQPVPAVAGQAQVKFKWNYTGTYGYSWSVDDISVTGTSPVTLSVTPANQSVTAPAGTTNFTVTTTATWSASSSSSWCTVTPSGTGNGTIVANYTDNLLTAQRIATITVTAPGATAQTVTVTQDGAAPNLAVFPSNQDVTAPQGTTSFSVTSNADWTVTSDVSWCTPTSSGSGNGTIVADYLENTLFTTRVATLTVNVAGLPAQTVTVTQAAATPSLLVTPSNQDVMAAEGTTDFTVTSNSAWTASSDSPWCIVTPSGSGNGTITANYTENTSASPRVASIDVTVSSLPVQTVTVSQEGSSISVGENDGSGIHIFPNPNRGVFKIVKSDGKPAAMDVTVQDLNGRTILGKHLKDSAEYELDLSPVAQGCYNIIIKTDDKVLIKKLVIIR